jgi:hypothetical protein
MGQNQYAYLSNPDFHFRLSLVEQNKAINELLTGNIKLDSRFN